jgi:hypothetical protein
MLLNRVETDLRNINFEFIDNATVYTEKSENYAWSLISLSII